MADVTPRSAKVLSGFTRLEYDERVELLKTLREYQDNNDTEIRKSLVGKYMVKAGISLGPISDDGCPCCGSR